MSAALDIVTNKEIDPDAQTALESLILGGDISKLKPLERIAYYNARCKSLGLDPYSKPFDYLKLQGKTVLYANRACSDQLRKLHNISIAITQAEAIDGIYVVRAKATMPNGRTDESLAAVVIKGLRDSDFANAIMKCETKAKRRVTLSICGLGMNDESEFAAVPGAERVAFDERPAVDGTPNDDLTAEMIEELESCMAEEDTEDALRRWHKRNERAIKSLSGKSRQRLRTAYGSKLKSVRERESDRGAKVPPGFELDPTTGELIPLPGGDDQ